MADTRSGARSPSWGFFADFFGDDLIADIAYLS